jgi:TrmH family RNA methyltransferase
LLYVVLVSTRNPLNIGAAARAMNNFGFSALRVANPYEVAWREARSAVGAADLLQGAKEFKTLADAVADCSLIVGTTAGTNRELLHQMQSLPTAANEIRNRAASENVALLFGSEKRGLSNDDLTQCHWLMRIPTRPEHASMNLGQAVAVCLYEISRPMKNPRSRAAVKASSEHLERLASTLNETLTISDYVKPNATVTTKAKIQRLVRRMELSPQDATDLLGMMNKILWKLKSRQRN